MTFRCPFYPHCDEEREILMQIMTHIMEDHKSVRSTTYGTKYQGNGSINTLEINMDKRDKQKVGSNSQ